GADRRPATLRPCRDYLYLLGLLPQCLWTRRRPAYRPHPAKPRAGSAPSRRRRTPTRTGLGKDQRSCARLDYAGRRLIQKAAICTAWSQIAASTVLNVLKRKRLDRL